MSGEHITNTSIQRDSENNQRDLKSRIKRKVDIFLLMNKLKGEELKERNGYLIKEIYLVQFFFL